jgi:hypothetical protein
MSGRARFDELAKVASGVSRRRALKLMGGGVIAATGALVTGGRAAAAPNECAVLCDQLFDEGPGQALCRQTCRECRKAGGSLCFSTTSGTITGVVCCPSEASVCCVDTSGNAFCCAAGDICDPTGGCIAA